MQQNFKLYHRSKTEIPKLKATRIFVSESPKWLWEDTNGYGDFLYSFVAKKNLKIFDPVEVWDDYKFLMKCIEKQSDEMKNWITNNLDEGYFPSGAYAELQLPLKGKYDGFKEGEDGYYTNYCLFNSAESLQYINHFDTNSNIGKAYFKDLCSKDNPWIVDDYVDWWDTYEADYEEF